MAKGCPLIYIGRSCGEYDKFPNDCVYMLNEGKDDKTLADFMGTQNKEWLKTFGDCFTSPNGIYSECVMANVIREAILQELKLRN